VDADKRQLISIQYLRAIAALMVVLHHARNSKQWLFNPLEGYNAFAWGVDIFFVLSGFIMYAAARKENHLDFLGRRIIRVVPLYWIATLALLSINTNFHIWWIGTDGFSHVLQSLFFIPHYSLSKPDHIWPYLIPGWTLNYEMLFYLIFYVGLMVKRPLLISTLAIFSLFSIGVIFSPETAPLKAYTRPILLEFLCGVWIAWAYTKGVFDKTIPSFIVIGFAFLFILPFINAQELTIAGRALASSMIIAGALYLGEQIPYFKLLHLLGDASYSIYLTHTFISLRYSSKIWSKVPLEGWVQFSGWVALTLVVSSIVGIVVHLYIEKPVLRWLRFKWENILRSTGVDKVSRKIA
jgi:exopolysaccharide production protein ExoZ